MTSGWEEPRAGYVLAGRWRLEDPLGGGSFGTVWRAVDGLDGSVVAVKLLHRAHVEDPKVVGRFLQEARIQAQIRHPCVVPVLEWRESPTPFLVMPLVDGESLHDRCIGRSQAGAELPLALVGWLVENMTGAVAAAHAQGVVHRDLKPKNVLVNRSGSRPFVKLLDFGVAKLLRGGELPPTTVGRVMGSVLYLAPEQISQGVEAGVSVDQFALASIFFELLPLRRAWARGDDGEPLPFHISVAAEGDNHQIQVLKRIVDGPRPSVLAHRPEVGAEASRVLLRALASAPEARFSDVASFGRALSNALRGRRTTGAETMDAEIPPRSETVEDVLSEPRLPPTARTDAGPSPVTEATVEVSPDPSFR